MKLRDYQRTAFAQARKAILEGKRPCILAPTGSGKSFIGAALLHWAAKNLPGPAVSLTHTREIIYQNARAYQRMTGEPVGIYSDGLGRKELDYKVMFAGVQSLINAADQIQPSLCLIDEAHRIPAKDESQYQKVFSQWPTTPIVGLTATPYRLDQGSIVDGAPFDVLIETITTQELVERGELSPLAGVESLEQIDTNHVRKRLGEFVTADLAQEATTKECLAATKQVIDRLADDRRRILVFGVDVSHTELLAEECGGRYIHGGLSMAERDDTLAWFREPGKERKILANCMILTTGFDQPDIDCIVIARPTLSKGMFVQMLGRGMRFSEDKADCKVIDLGGNFLRHSPLDEIPEFIDEPGDARKEAAEKEGTTPRGMPSLYLHTGLETDEWKEVDVFRVTYKITKNRKRPGIKQLMAMYRTSVGSITDWILPEHDRYARKKAEAWAMRRGIVPCPRSAEELCAQAWISPAPKRFVARKDGAFWRIKQEQFEQK